MPLAAPDAPSPPPTPAAALAPACSRNDDDEDGDDNDDGDETAAVSFADCQSYIAARHSMIVRSGDRFGEGEAVL